MSISILNKYDLEVSVKFLTTDKNCTHKYTNIQPGENKNFKIEEGDYLLKIKYITYFLFPIKSPGTYEYDHNILSLFSLEDDERCIINSIFLEDELKDDNQEVEDEINTSIYDVKEDEYKQENFEVSSDEIGIRNISNSLWLDVRISAQGGGSEEFVKLECNQLKVWPRKYGQTYHMQVGYWGGGGENGPTVNLRPGEIYEISDSFEVYDYHGIRLDYSYDKFRSAKDYPSQNEIKYQEDDQPHSDNDDNCDNNTNNDSHALTNTIKPTAHKIQIGNLTQTNISVRVEKDSISTDDYFRIKPNNFEIFSREKGKYLIEVSIQERKFRFYCKTYEVYFFKESDILVDHKGKIIKSTLDTIDKKSEPIKQNKTKSYKIIVKNTSDKLIIIRIQSKGKGTEDFQHLFSQEEKSWKRDEGKYIMELIYGINILSYYVESNNTYIFTPEDQVINQENKIPIPQTNDSFFLSSYKDYDLNDENSKCDEINKDDDIIKYNDLNKDNNTYKQDEYKYEIDNDKYEESKITGNEIENNINNKEQEQKEKENTNEILNNQDEKEVLYFNDIKPNYSGTGVFTDHTFPPDEYTINSINRLTGELNKTHFDHSSYTKFGTENLMWKRPIQIWGKKYSLFKDDIEPEDIKQGQIGNCYLLSAISALARKPHLIEKIFKTRGVNPNGYYEIYYYELNGERRIMFLDDNFLLLKDFRFLSATPNGPEIYVLLLEKAFAKYEGGYTNMTSGCESWVFKFFTGSVVKHYDQKGISNSWEDIVSAIKKNHICTVGSISKSGMTDQDATPEGIYYGHSYSLLDAKEYNDGKVRIRLVLLRNPHGVGEWKGDFSDESTTWTPELENYFDLDQALGENGIFWMPFEKFKESFSQMFICYC